MKPKLNASWYEVTPLLMATWKSNVHFVTALLENGANANRKMIIKDFLLLRQLKLTGPNSIGNTSSRSMSSVLSNSEFSQINNFSNTNNVQILQSYPQQYGFRVKYSFPPDFVNEKFILPFEHAMAMGQAGLARLLLSRYF